MKKDKTTIKEKISKIRRSDEGKPFYKQKAIWCLLILLVIVVGLGAFLYHNSQTATERKIEELSKAINLDELPLELEDDSKKTKKEEALNKAELYANVMLYSEEKVREELENAAENFSNKAIDYAMKNLDIDWKETALMKAEFYDSFGRSKADIKNTLIEEDGFTEKQADYAIENMDFNGEK